MTKFVLGLGKGRHIPLGRQRPPGYLIIMDDDRSGKHEDKWFFDVQKKYVPQANELSFGRVKAFLYENLRDSISRHDISRCFQLLRLLPKETSLDPYVLFRFIFILIESNSTERVHKNVLIYLESLISKLDLNKPDIFVEFLAYFVKNNRIDDARELFAHRHRFMAYQVHRPLPFVDVNLRCYEFLLNYLEWNDRVSNDMKKDFDVSIQGWIVNTLDSLRTTKSNHEYFVMCLIRMLLFYGYTRKAYLFSSEFQRNNHQNISAQLLHNHLLDRLSNMNLRLEHEKNSQVPMDCDFNEDERERNRTKDLETINNFSLNVEDEMIELNRYPIVDDKKAILNNLRRLDPSRNELLAPNLHDNQIDTLKDLMDGMEVLHEVNNMNRWVSLGQVLNNIFNSNDEILKTDARCLWQTRYRRFWKSIEFHRLPRREMSDEELDTILSVTRLIHTELDRPIKS